MLSKNHSFGRNPCPVQLTAGRISIFVFGFKEVGDCIKKMLACGASSFVKPIDLLAVKQLVLAMLVHLLIAPFMPAFTLRRAALVSPCCFWIQKKALKRKLKSFYSLKINIRGLLLSLPLDTGLSSSFRSHETEILTSSALVVLYKN